MLKHVNIHINHWKNFSKIVIILYNVQILHRHIAFLHIIAISICLLYTEQLARAKLLCASEWVVLYEVDDGHQEMSKTRFDSLYVWFHKLNTNPGLYCINYDTTHVLWTTYKCVRCRVWRYTLLCGPIWDTRIDCNFFVF